MYTPSKYIASAADTMITRINIIAIATNIMDIKPGIFALAINTMKAKLNIIAPGKTSICIQSKYNALNHEDTMQNAVTGLAKVMYSLFELMHTRKATVLKDNKTVLLHHTLSNNACIATGSFIAPVYNAHAPP